MDYLPSMGSQLDTTEVTKHIQYFSYTFFRATTGGGGEWIFNSRLQWESNNNNLKKRSEKGNIKIEQKLITYIHFLKNLGGAHHVACRILVPWPGIELHPWQWKQRVLTARLTGDSQLRVFLKQDEK